MGRVSTGTRESHCVSFHLHGVKFLPFDLCSLWFTPNLLSTGDCPMYFVRDFAMELFANKIAHCYSHDNMS